MTIMIMMINIVTSSASAMVSNVAFELYIGVKRDDDGPHDDDEKSDDDDDDDRHHDDDDVDCDDNYHRSTLCVTNAG